MGVFVVSFIYVTMLKRLLLLYILCMGVSGLSAQIHGVVTDGETGEPLPYINVYYDGKGVGTITNIDGEYTIASHPEWERLMFSMVGYRTASKKISARTRELNVKMKSDLMLDEVVVRPRKEKYSRKNNPAVEMMKKVVSAKKMHDLSKHDYYTYDKYQKITFSLNDITTDSLNESGLFKKYPFFKDQVEQCSVTGKNILPISVDETVSQKLFRKSPHSEKTLIKGLNSTGVNELFNTGDMLTVVLKDVFQDINIYDDEFRFLQYPFDSPISKKGIAFYKYYIMDTLTVNNEDFFHLTFVPNNSQDFGFTGHLYVYADSTYRVSKCVLNLPKKTDVNFVDNMVIIQKFGALPTGEWVLMEDDMLSEMSYMKKIFGSVQVRRTTRYSNFGFEEIPDRIFKKKGEEIKDVNAMMRDDSFWNDFRPETLSKSESRMDDFIANLSQIKGFKYIIFVAKAFIENFVETSPQGKPSKVDIGPVNTMIGKNYIDGFRMRASAQTTANFHPNLFLSGYYAYGFKDKKSKYKAQVEYSFKKREYSPREYPINSLTFTYQYDDMAPTDKFMGTDKDNVFTAFKFTTVDQFNYERNASVKYELESETGLKSTFILKHANYEPCGKLFYRTMSNENKLQNSDLPAAQWEMASLDNNNPLNIHDFSIAEATIGLRYAPGETFINTKQRRLPINLDAPVFTLQHTVGVKGVLGSDYDYNLTEASFYKRIWLNSWGNIDVYGKGGVQWNKVPFPLLIMPAANLSYILQDNTFSLINNMEFLNDRYASLDVSWNLQGKIFNRIPLLNKLKWREFIAVKCLWGTLTDKNNPFRHIEDDMLMMFPGHYTPEGKYEYSSYLMDKKKPYVEVSAGIHNIFKLLHVEYVRRLNYNELPTANKWGVRLMIRTVF